MWFGVNQNTACNVKKYFRNPSFYETNEKFGAERDRERERGHKVSDSPK
jgi:hypothetical protein